MAFCPKCKLEYVAGVKICPDCKEVLVDNLNDNNESMTEEQFQEEFEDTMYKMAEKTDSAEEFLDQNPVVKEMVETLKSRGLTDAEIQEILDGIKNRAVNASGTYNLISDKYNEHKSGALVLILCGIAGLAVLVLNLLNVINLPFSGFSRYLTTGVMGALFLIFLLSGIKSAMMIKKLAPMVEEEEMKIKEIVDFLKQKQSEGAFDVDTEGLSMEEASLLKSNFAVQACEKNFEDLAPGLSFYVTDRYYNEIFGEEEFSENISHDDGSQV